MSEDVTPPTDMSSSSLPPGVNDLWWHRTQLEAVATILSHLLTTSSLRMVP